MEMYADEESRGGILEPEGIVGIKFRREKQLETMTRLDSTYAELKQALTDRSLAAEKQSEIKAKIKAREELLLPVYSQISIQFADLHDRAGRMVAKDTIRHALVWKEARRFFYWRLRRRLNEESILKKMATTSIRGPVSRATNLQSLQAWTGLAAFEKDDRAVAMWYEENKKTVHAKVEALKADGVAFDIGALLRGNKEGGLRGIRQMLSVLPVEEREATLKYLSGT